MLKLYNSLTRKKEVFQLHHECEIAQMESISGKKPLAKYWLHSGFLEVETMMILIFPKLWRWSL